MPDPADIPPQPPADRVPGSAQPVSETTGLPRNIAAGLASIFTLVGGIVFLVLERRDRFVRFYALQSIYLGAVILIISGAITVMNFIFSQLPLIGSVLGGVLNILKGGCELIWLVLWVVMIVKAFMGQEWAIPYLGALVRRQIAPRGA